MGRESKVRREREALLRRHRITPLAHLRRDPELFELHLEVLTILIRELDKGRGLAEILAAIGGRSRTFDAQAARRPEEREFPDPEASTPERRVRLRLACEPGCAWCCHLRVTATAAEVLALAAELRATLDADALAGLRRRLDEHEARAGSIEPQLRIHTPLLCPLNVDGRCVAYAARPLGCRKFHSFSAATCRGAVERGSFAAIRVPIDPRRYDSPDVYRQSLNLVLAALGLGREELELVPALRIALDAEDLAAAWADGRLAAAHRPALIAATHDDHARQTGVR